MNILDTITRPVIHKGRKCWPASEMLQLLGYTGNDVCNILRKSAKGEFIEGIDFDILTSSELEPFRNRFGISFRVKHLTVLYESGINLLSMRTTSPIGVILRRHILNLLDEDMKIIKVRKDKKQKMSKVFLGGTCNESSWRSHLIPMLKINYFNPVVENWTMECMAEEIRQREICDLCLYCITPRMTGVYSIAEVVDDSNKRPHKTVLILLHTDGDLKFNLAQWNSLNAVASMVRRNGSVVFESLKTAADWINNHQEKGWKEGRNQ